MPKTKPTTRKDDGYPFGTGDWARWTNVKRLNWMRNFRDKLRDNYKDTFGFTDEQIAKLDADVAEMERIVAAEQQQIKRNAASAKLDALGDQLLGMFDDSGAKKFTIPPNDILGRRSGN